MNKHQSNLSKDVKYLVNFLGINYRQAKNYLKDYKNRKRGRKMQDKNTMCNACRDAFKEILMNLRSIDKTDNIQVESYVDDSIKIAVKMLEGDSNE